MRDEPPIHVLEQAPPAHAAFAFGCTQLKHVGPVPHWVASVSWAQVDAQRWVPGVEQVKSQLLPLQLGVPPVGAVQAVQLGVPQLLTLALLTHAPPHAWKPDWQAQVPPAHTVLPALHVAPAQHAC